MTERDEPSRRNWLPSALPALFGEEPLSDPWSAIRNGVAAFAAQAGAIRDQALHDAASLDGFDAELLSFDSGSWAAWQEATDDFNAPMRVVLMGRTHGMRISYCGSRSATQSRKSQRVRFATSVSSVSRSSSLSTVASPSKVSGSFNLRRFPERVFGRHEGLVDQIRRHMAAAAVEPLDVVYVHALAATEALAHGGEIDAELREASRIDDLTKALNREYATHSESRRALRVVDGQRRQVDRIVFSLLQSSASLRARADHTRGLNDDLHARLARVTRSAGSVSSNSVECLAKNRNPATFPTTPMRRMQTSG